MLKISRGYIEQNLRDSIPGRVEFIKKVLADSGASGIVLGLSGGKDSAIVSKLCKMATSNVFGIIMPCNSILKDKDDALLVAEAFDLTVFEVNLDDAYKGLFDSISKSTCFLSQEKLASVVELNGLPAANIKPRLRMTTLYAIGQALNCLVAGTGNRSEAAVGYFTKWGDGACDFNPISDLTVTELMILGEILEVPSAILEKAPSAGLWDGQTDEDELGISYQFIDSYLLSDDFERESIEENNGQKVSIIKDRYKKAQHKLNPIPKFKDLSRL